MKQSIIIKLEVPTHFDPVELVNMMMDDFFYANRHTDDLGEHLGEITFEILPQSDIDQ